MLLILFLLLIPFIGIFIISTIPYSVRKQYISNLRQIKLIAPSSTVSNKLKDLPIPISNRGVTTIININIFLFVSFCIIMVFNLSTIPIFVSIIYLVIFMLIGLLYIFVTKDVNHQYIYTILVDISKLAIITLIIICPDNLVLLDPYVQHMTLNPFNYIWQYVQVHMATPSSYFRADGRSIVRAMPIDLEFRKAVDECVGSRFVGQDSSGEERPNQDIYIKILKQVVKDYNNDN